MKQSKVLLLFLILIIKNIKAEDIRLDTVEIKIKKQHEFVEQQSAIPLKIIDHKTIKTLKATQLLDVLSKEDSVHLVKNGNKLSPSLYGFSPEHTLMLVDGMRMAMEPMNIFELERIQLSNIDRIEIISGPLSSIYGADALGGVINIITKKKADKKPFKLTLKNSTYDFKSGKNSLMLGFNEKINFEIIIEKNEINDDLSVSILTQIITTIDKKKIEKILRRSNEWLLLSNIKNGAKIIVPVSIDIYN